MTTKTMNLLGLIGVCCFLGALLTQAAPNQSQNVCKRELENANKSISTWGDTMETMINESKLPTTIRDSVHAEANKILDMIEEFGQQVRTNHQANQLARDLVTIRRRANRMALDIYLNTFDMRWPQNSLQLGIIVERVQQACLDRAAIQALESPPNPMDFLGLTEKQKN